MSLTNLLDCDDLQLNTQNKTLLAVLPRNSNIVSIVIGNLISTE